MDASLFLGFAFAHHIVAFLSHGYFHRGGSGFESTSPDISATDFSQKERDIICYLSGYVFGTLSRRIRNSKHWNSQINNENLKVLLAGKIENIHNDLTCLWKVRPEVCKIFSVAEFLFKYSTTGFVHSIDVKQIVAKLLVNAEILSNYSLIYSDTKVGREIAFNLLDHMLTLYLRVRSFSWTKLKPIK